MKILVTGAAGFVGGCFMKTFKATNQVYGLGRRAGEHVDFLMDLNTKNFDIDLSPDVVIHCAAKSSPWGSYQDFYKNNVVATQNVIEFCKIKKVNKLIYISSSSVFYKNEDQFGISENTSVPHKFVNDYAMTKYLGEKLVREQFPNHVILRPRAVYGPGDTVLFPRVLAAAKKGKLPVVKNKTVQGDLIYIENLCHYMMRACLTDVVGDFNLTDGKPVVIQDFLSEILHQLGFEMKFVTVSIRNAMMFAGAIEMIYKMFKLKTEPPITRFGVGVFSYSKTFDVSKARAHFGSVPISTEEGVRRFVDWQRGRRQ